MLIRFASNPAFQRWAARFPLTRWFVRREGEALFDLLAGFCHSQILTAFVVFDLPRLLADGPCDAATLGRGADVPTDRMEVLLNGAVSLGLLRCVRAGYRLTARGAALGGVPGLAGMIRHNAVLYRDLSDPAAFFRGEIQTELAEFWPYVFGAGAAHDPDSAARYSRLMADSVQLVADDTLASVSLHGVRCLMDVGGGTGAFLAAAADAAPGMKLMLFDLPAVAPAAVRRFADLGISDRLSVFSGSFRDDPLPQGADTISLVRVLYDHSDDTVAKLLASAYRALPPGGRLIISEPMAGDGAGQRAGDAYFALYCMAMRTGRARSRDEIVRMVTAAGFGRVRLPRSNRPFITSVIEAVRQV